MTLDDIEREFWGDQREQPARVRLARVVRAMKPHLAHAHWQGRHGHFGPDEWADIVIKQIIGEQKNEEEASHR